MASFTLYQGLIKNYSATDPRSCDILQLPDNYLVRSVQLPRLLQNQTKPLEGSLVLFTVLDSYNAYVISVIREPLDFLDQDGELTGDTTVTSNQLAPGEIMFESRGDPSVVGPGTGATLRLGNDGTISAFSGLRKEYLVLGGTDTDDDNEVILNGDNGFFQSNINDVTKVQSLFRFDEINDIQVGNVLATLGTSLTTVPIVELTMDTTGNIRLHNFTGLTENGRLRMDVTGQITLGNPASSIIMAPAGPIAITGSTINLNNGSLGAARVTDSTISNPTLDPKFWLMLETIQEFFTVLATFTGGSPVIQSQLGVLGAAYLAVVPTAPVSLAGQVSSGSSSVVIGG